MKFSPSENVSHLATIFDVELDVESSTLELSIKSDEAILAGLKKLPEDMDFDHIDEQYDTLLCLAAEHNYTKTANYLLNVCFVDPNVTVPRIENRTAIYIAATHGHLGMVQLLTRTRGIQLSIQDKYGETPLFRAIGTAPEEKLLTTVTALINKDKTTISIPNEDGIFPIEGALSRMMPEVIEFLLAQGADVPKRCTDVAVHMMMEASGHRSKNSFTFFVDTPENTRLRDCTKLIIEGYNKLHFAEDLRAFAAKHANKGEASDAPQKAEDSPTASNMPM